MNKRQIVASLNSIANELDTKGLFKEANEVTEVMVRISQYSELTPGSSAGKSVGLNTPEPDSDSLGPKIRMPYDAIPGLGSKPGKSDSSTPKNSVGLSRWVNKAENIYSAWVSKGAKPNSTDAEGLIQDIIDYMEKVKLNMRPSLHSAADYKIDKVKTLKAAISLEITLPGYAIATPYGSISGVKPYGDVSGFPGKGVNPFTYDTSKRMTGTQLDYQARNEGKSY